MKKFLSLVLALAMTMSLVTVSAGAKDFTDADDITYVEAVEVMTAIGVVSGDTAGNFNATAGLTRGAAAKIICNLILGPTTASALNADAAPYKDVPANSTFAGYIAFCAKEGIISGYADGTFKPAAPLTGYAFMKMLLGALGYDKSVEGYEGANWSINVAKRALNIGLDDGLVDTFNGSDYVTREEAMLYAFNALQADMVTYDTTITIGDVTIAGSKAETMENKGKTDGNIGNKDGVMQFAEKYFTNLKDFEDTDAFMRPATTWKIKSETVGTYSETPDLSYTSTVKVGTIYSDLGLTDGIADANTTVYEDGVSTTTKALTWTGFDIVKGSRSEIGGNGALTEVFYDSDADTVIFVVVNTYVAEVNAVYKATTTKDAYITIKTDSPYTKPDASPFNTAFETDAFAKENVVAYTYSMKDGENCIESMALAEKVTGAMTAYTTNGSVTVGSKIDANTKSADNIADFVTTVDKGTDVTVYVDEYGYGLYVDADTTAQYAVLLAYEAGNSLDNARAKLLFTDGTVKTVDVYLQTAWGSKNGELSENEIVSYAINGDGVYELTLVAEARTATGSKNLTKNGYLSVDLSDSQSDSQYVNKLTDDVVCNEADAETIFLVADTTGTKTTCSAYVGIANVPTITLAASKTTTTAALKESGESALSVVFIVRNSHVTVSSDNKDVIYVKGNSNGTSYTTALGTYYEYDAFLNGEPTTIKVDEANRMQAATLIYGPAYNTKGIMVGCEDKVTVSYSGDTLVNDTNGDLRVVAGTKSVKNDVIKLGGASYAYTSDVNVYYVDVDGKLIVTTISAIGEDDDDVVLFKLNDKGRLTDVYVKVVDEADTVDGEEVVYTGVVDAVTAADLADSVCEGAASYITKGLKGEVVDGVLVVTGTISKGYSFANTSTTKVPGFDCDNHSKTMGAYVTGSASKCAIIPVTVSGELCLWLIYDTTETVTVSNGTDSVVVNVKNVVWA